MGNNNEKVDLTLSSEEFYKRYGRKKTVGMFTLGCKVNQYETEAMAALLKREGYEIVDFDEKADVYLINTCTVTNLSDRKSRQMIRRAKTLNEDAIIVVTGCYAQTASDEVAAIPGVNLVIGTRDRGRLMDYIHEIAAGKRQLNVVNDIMKIRRFEELEADICKDRTRAYLKIQEGCNQFCAYCIIPYARGPIRSRQPEAVIQEVKKLAEGGFREIVLTGIHVASYGKDIKNTSLIDIIQRVHEIQGIDRIRLGSIEPNTLSPEFIDMAKKLEKLCPHYHVSLQSGCNETLKRMNRRYTVEQYRKYIYMLRENIPDVAVTTDVMVGFPGETEEEFNQTCRFLDEISFARMHIFKYSPRKGTPAATFKDQVPPEVKEQRSNILLQLSKEKNLQFNKKFIGRVMPVLFEQEVKGESGFIEGLTPNYIRVKCQGNNTMKGEICDIKLIDAKEDFMYGSLSKEE